MSAHSEAQHWERETVGFVFRQVGAVTQFVMSQDLHYSQAYNSNRLKASLWLGNVLSKIITLMVSRRTTISFYDSGGQFHVLAIIAGT